MKAGNMGRKKHSEKEEKKPRRETEKSLEPLETPRDNTNDIETHIPSTQNCVRQLMKHSKLKEKPSFKSRKKANPRLSQKNKISNYFSNAGTIGRGTGGIEGESPIMDDLNVKVLSTRLEIRPGPRTYKDNGPDSFRNKFLKS